MLVTFQRTITTVTQTMKPRDAEPEIDNRRNRLGCARIGNWLQTRQLLRHAIVKRCAINAD